MEYIDSASDTEKSQQCVFCNALGCEDDSVHIIERRESCFSLMNKYPYNNGHLMVAPLKHVAGLDCLDRNELADLFELVRDSQAILDAVMSPHGYNVGINIGRVAGAGVPGHIHIHIVPRWNGDMNFMPVIGDTKVIPQALEATYRLLKTKKIELFDNKR
jgi:ATP adenylyltransferase